MKILAVLALLVLGWDYFTSAPGQSAAVRAYRAVSTSEFVRSFAERRHEVPLSPHGEE